MNEKRFFLGSVVSVLWLAAMAYLIVSGGSNTISMKPNEWGDFFAGVFAPLAFLWLVLGYLQQGEELNLSTRALLLQAEELKNSVSQQRELVEVTRQQVESDREALAYERHLRTEEAKPSFVLVGSGGSFRGDGHSTYSILISNTGNAATGLLVVAIPPTGPTVRLLDMALFERGRQQAMNYATPTPLNGDSTRLLLTFKDILGTQHEIAYLVTRETNDPHSSLALAKIEV
jgi:hypothetical protein